MILFIKLLLDLLLTSRWQDKIFVGGNNMFPFAHKIMLTLY